LTIRKLSAQHAQRTAFNALIKRVNAKPASQLSQCHRLKIAAFVQLTLGRQRTTSAKVARLTALNVHQKVFVNRVAQLTASTRGSASARRVTTQRQMWMANASSVPSQRFGMETPVSCAHFRTVYSVQRRLECASSAVLASCSRAKSALSTKRQPYPALKIN